MGRQTSESMSTTLTETPAATCEWCGQENTERLPSCAGCGTRLVSEPAPAPAEKRKGKDLMTAVCLALIAGPLGLIYINAWGTMLVLLLIRGFFFCDSQRRCLGGGRHPAGERGFCVWVV